MLAYTKNADTTRQSVWVADRNGKHGRRLARGRAPVVSPDGRQVAFAGGCTGDPPAECTKLFVVSSGGGTPRSLGPGEEPVWTRDSSRIVARSGRQLVSIEVESGEKAMLDRGSFFGWTIAPSGRKVAYGRGPSDDPLRGMDLFVVDIGGGGRRQLTHDRRSGNPVWGPRRIAFTKFRRRSGYPAYDLWTVAPDGRGARLVVRGKTVADRFRLNDVLGLFPFEWGADGRRLLTTYMTELAETPFALDVRSGAVRRLWRTRARDVVASGLSTDGRLVLLEVSPSPDIGPINVETVPYAGGRPRVLVRAAREPSWNF
jgi:hypothetical protein